MDIKDTFEELADQWDAETMFHSMPHAILGHPNYAKLVALGKPILPLIFARQAADPQGALGMGWLTLLHAITGVNPIVGDDVAPGMIGVNVSKMNELWRDWAREQELI